MGIVGFLYYCLIKQFVLFLSLSVIDWVLRSGHVQLHKNGEDKGPGCRFDVLKHLWYFTHFILNLDWQNGMDVVLTRFFDICKQAVLS